MESQLSSQVKALKNKYELSDEVLSEFYNYRDYKQFYPRWMELRVLVNRFIKKHLMSEGSKISRLLEVGSDPRIPLANYKGYVGSNVEYVSSNVHKEVDKCYDLERTYLEDSEEYDCVICTEVLEHLKKPEQAIFNIRRMLRPNGLLLLTVPVCFRIHGKDYQRLLPDGILKLLNETGFVVEELLYDDVLVEDNMPLSIRIAARKIIKPSILFLGAGMKYDHLRYFIPYARVLTTDTLKYAPTRFICDKSIITSDFNSESFSEELKNIIKREKIDIVIPTSHYSLFYIYKNRERIEKTGTFVLTSDNATLAKTLDKIKMNDHLMLNSFNVPVTYDNPEMVKKYPVILKPISGTSSNGVQIVKDVEQLRYHLKHSDGDMMIQEFIEGIEYTVDVYCNPDGSVVSIVPRIRMEIQAGLSIKSRTVRDEKLICCIDRYCKSNVFIGPICIQVIVDNNGNIFFIDVNPRMGGTTNLSMEAGLNMPKFIIANFEGHICKPDDTWRNDLVLSRYYGGIYYEE